MRILGLSLPWFRSQHDKTSEVSYVVEDIGDCIWAVSTRKLFSTYAGSCLRVRRVSDNAEQDIGFVNDSLDTGAIASFCGASECVAMTWYGQAPNGIGCEQTFGDNRQPLVYDGSSTYTSGGRPALFFRGDQASTSLNDNYDTTNLDVPQLTDDPGSTNRPWLLYVVFQALTFTDLTTGAALAAQSNNIIKFGTTSNNPAANHLFMFLLRPETDHLWLDMNDASYNPVVLSDPWTEDSAYLLARHNMDLTPNNEFYWKDVIVASGAATATDDLPWANLTQITVAFEPSRDVRNFHGYISEIVMFDGDKDSSITDIQNYIEGYYTIDP